jgi:hypothetical protein
MEDAFWLDIPTGGLPGSLCACIPFQHHSPNCHQALLVLPVRTNHTIHHVVKSITFLKSSVWCVWCMLHILKVCPALNSTSLSCSSPRCYKRQASIWRESHGGIITIMYMVWRKCYCLIQNYQVTEPNYFMCLVGNTTTEISVKSIYILL